MFLHPVETPAVNSWPHCEGPRINEALMRQGLPREPGAMLFHPMILRSTLALLLLTSCGRDSQVSSPNVILISLDTLRADHMGTYGYQRSTTPFLDELAKDALVYDNARTTWTWTLIAHMSLLTGFYPKQHQVWSSESALAPGPWTLATRLKAAGYETLGAYNTPGWLEPRFGFDRGFDHYEAHTEVKQALANVDSMLGKRDSTKPLLLFLHLFDIHNGRLLDDGPLYNPPQPWADRFMESAESIAREAGMATPRGKQVLWTKGSDELTDRQRVAIQALYDGGIAYVDDQLRQFFERLEGTGLLEDSIVIITSDHGEGLGMRWKRFGGHGGTFEEGMRVPLIIQLPGDDRPRGRIGTPVTHVDLVPTILDLCGLPPDRRLPGYSLIGEAIPSRVIFGQHSDRSVSYHGKWKVIKDDGLKNVQVYDLQADPGEVAQVPDMKEWQELQDLGLRLRADAVGRQSDWFQPGVVRAEGSAEEHDAAMEALGYGGDR